MYINEIKDYDTAREFFFKSMNSIISKRIQDLLDKELYSTEQPLGELLKQLSDDELAYYIWKDTYSRAYVFDKYDQRRELMNALTLAKTVVNSESLKKEYIENHDEFVRKEELRKTNTIIDTIVK